LEQAFHLVNEGWKLEDVTLRIPKGFNPFIGLQPAVAEFLVQCDGERSLERVIAGFAANVKAPREQVQRECLEAVRKLIERGFLLC
jgi:hypothetical protein